MKNSEYPKLSELRPGTNVNRPVYLRKMEDCGKTQAGKSFVALYFYDGYTSVKASLFDVTVATLRTRGIEENNIYFCKFFKNDRGYVNLDGDPIACIDPDIKTTDFGQHIEEDPEGLFSRILQVIDLVRPEVTGVKAGYAEGERTLTDLTVALLNKYHDEFVRSSAAVSMHHEKAGGLVLHSYNVTCVAKLMTQFYKKLDAELMVCGAALHDIGKIREYKTDDLGFASYNKLGQGLGHMIYGIEIVEEEARNGNYNKEKVELLKHIIASHHGELEYGAVAKPCIPEAILIHNIDDGDAKMDMFEKVYADMKPGENSEKTIFALDTKVYKPTYK